ncbi:hypothetical protein B5S28_g608 [[Candida] boidinii]|nr:hypothetical protein B5S28_g608 [[Candida] boidinii]OWB72514.1 hypothetical protein B5S31_g2229 [[Candida] boidinii]
MSEIDFESLSNKLSPLEIETLQQYQALSKNIELLSQKIDIVVETIDLNNETSLVDKLRDLEMRMGLISTLFKSSVYQVVSNNNISNGNGVEDADSVNVIAAAAVAAAAAAAAVTHGDHDLHEDDGGMELSSTIGEETI